MELRRDKQIFKTDYSVCLDCGFRAVSADTQSCCGGTYSGHTRLSDHCTQLSRVAEYFDILRKIKVWPPFEKGTHATIRDLEKPILEIISEAKHHCHGKAGCKLQICLENLRLRIIGVVSLVAGIGFEPVRPVLLTSAHKVESRVDDWIARTI